MSSTAAAVAREATTHDLWTQAAEVAGRLNRAHGELVEIAAQLVEGGHWGDGGFSSPEHLLVVRAGLSPAQAGDVVRIARRRAELPDAMAALAAGELSIGQAAVVARHGRADHQAGIAAFARTATVPQLRRALSTSVFLDPDTGMPSTASTPDAGAPVTGAPGPEPAVDAPDDPSGDPSDNADQDRTAPDNPLAALRAAEAQRLADRACARPDLSMHYDESGRFHLRYSAPAEIGALVEQAVKEAKDALFTAATGTDGRSPADRAALAGGADARSARPTYADAIAEIASRSLSTINSTSRASHYRVYLHLDTGGGWVNGGGAITPRMAARFSCDGTVTPLWETEGRPISVGRDQRILPARTRRLIEDRDRGCRIPGCSTTRFVEIHHLDHWADGGATDFDTQVSLCPFHHDAHHRGDITVTGDPTRPDGLTVTNRYGLPIRPPTATELAPVRSVGDPIKADAADAGPPAVDPPESRPYPSPSGGPMRARDVEFVPDAWQIWRQPAREHATDGQPPPLRFVSRT
ncbi:MAG: DUF222 domain-containing protein [Pedococcus sp.]